MMSRTDSVKNGFPLVFHAHHFSSLILFPLISQGIGYAHKKKSDSLLFKLHLKLQRNRASFKMVPRSLRCGVVWCHGVVCVCVATVSDRVTAT